VGVHYRTRKGKTTHGLERLFEQSKRKGTPRTTRLPLRGSLTMRSSCCERLDTARLFIILGMTKYWYCHIKAAQGNTMTRQIGPTLAALALTLASVAHAQADTGQPPAGHQTSQARPDKSGYNLFNPTPADLMRPLSADRPDRTESPYTVDAGHFQGEWSIIDFTYSGASSGTSTDTIKALPSNLKLGVLNNVDVQFVFDPYIHKTEKTGNTTVTEQGFGDMQVRTKINLWGNDGGKTAFALMPFIQLPTGTGGVGSNYIEGGLIIPFAVELSDTLTLGTMLELDAVRNETNTGYGMAIVHSVVLGMKVTEKLGTYLEYAGDYGVKTELNYQATIGFGGTYALTDNLQLDIGTALGLTDATDKVKVFAGFTWRY
jgi:hypothetical protein